jgi:hypothetical protein
LAAARFEFLAKFSQFSFLLLNLFGKILERDRNGRHMYVLSLGREGGCKGHPNTLANMDEKASGGAATPEQTTCPFIRYRRHNLRGQFG